MYFNARKYFKDMKKLVEKENLNRFMISWAIKEHATQNGFEKIVDWNSKTKPTPLTEKEIKKFKGE